MTDGGPTTVHDTVNTLRRYEPRSRSRRPPVRPVLLAARHERRHLRVRLGCQVRPVRLRADGVDPQCGPGVEVAEAGAGFTALAAPVGPRQGPSSPSPKARQPAMQNFIGLL